MNNNKSLSSLLLAVSMASAPLFMVEEAQAQIYKCVNTQEKVFYNDKPCPVTQLQSKMKSVKDPKNGFIPEPFSPVVTADEKQNSGKKGVVVGDNSLNNDTSSKNQTLANQAAGNSGSAGAKNKNSLAESVSGKTSVVLGESADLNATTTVNSTNKPYMH